MNSLLRGIIGGLRAGAARVRRAPGPHANRTGAASRAVGCQGKGRPGRSRYSCATPQRRRPRQAARAEGALVLAWLPCRGYCAGDVAGERGDRGGRLWEAAERRDDSRLPWFKLYDPAIWSGKATRRTPRLNLAVSTTGTMGSGSFSRDLGWESFETISTHYALRPFIVERGPSKSSLATRGNAAAVREAASTGVGCPVERVRGIGKWPRLARVEIFRHQSPRGPRSRGLSE